MHLLSSFFYFYFIFMDFDLFNPIHLFYLILFFITIFNLDEKLSRELQM